MKPILILAAIALIGFFAFRAMFGGQTVSWNQRLTVVVQTPAGEVSGSAVTEVTNTDTTGGVFLPPEARRVISKVRGEAVAVEVLPGRWLFALLGGREDGKGEAGDWVYPAFVAPVELTQSERSYEREMEIVADQPLDTPVSLPEYDWPLFVTFEDVTRPETVRLLDPQDLSTTFGAGVSLLQVKLEVTEIAVSEGHIDELLGWLGPYPEPALGPSTGVTTDIPFYRVVHMGDFVRRD